MKGRMIIILTLLALFQIHLFEVADAFINLQYRGKRIPLITGIYKNVYIQRSQTHTKVGHFNTILRQGTDLSLLEDTTQLNSAGVVKLANEEEHS